MAMASAAVAGSLVGDALHAFPPDLGQGVNSALCDVLALGDCFKDDPDDTVTIPMALKRYERKNGPETRALVALARCGAPYQYNQPSLLMRFGKTLWTVNVAFRLLLNKITGGVSPKPAVIQMMNPSLSFRQIMRRANTLTVLLWASSLLLLRRIILSAR